MSGLMMGGQFEAEAKSWIALGRLIGRATIPSEALRCRGEDQGWQALPRPAR